MRTLVIFFWTNQTPTQGNSKKGGKGFYETDTQIRRRGGEEGEGMNEKPK
jgi:hypothetical protein